MSSGYFLRCSLAVVSVLLFLGPKAEISFCQTSTAALTGTVRDVTGAVLPDVIVIVRSTDRNTRESTRTNELGRYSIPVLNPGTYVVVAELTGFGRSVR